MFELEPKELLRAAGYVTPTADRPDQVDPPVRPRVTTLPLAELHPDVFEAFSAEFLQYVFTDGSVTLFGAQGHKQDGIDGRIDHRSGDRWTFQCKRHQQFGPADVRAAVTAVKVSANKHLLFLTRVASPGARKEIDKHQGWELWDVEDISRTIRTRLSKGDALRLIDTFFPGWREAFLGVSEPGPWLTPTEFYRPVSGSTLYSHEWTLVGRQDEVRAAEEFLDAPDSRFALLVGRGGIGKTRLLGSIAEDAERTGWVVRFLDRSTVVQQQHHDHLPAGQRLLVVIDDAHERDDLAALLAGINRDRPEAKVILSLRPYGLAPATHELRKIGLHPSELPTWTLDDLSTEDAYALAREALADSHPEAVAARLASVSADCPLITVVGAALIRRGLLDPSRLEGSESIREEILRAFRDAIVSDPASGDPELRRSVLDAVAAAQPFRFHQPEFPAAIEVLTGAPLDRVQRHVRSLEDAGVLLRRGQTYRIVPDLLGDVILAQAARDERTGIDTGYLERVLANTTGAVVEHLFVNASRVDWQTRQGETSLPSIADALWEALEESLRPAGVRGRLALLKLVRRVAYFQPDRALALIKWVVANPTDVIEPSEYAIGNFYPPTPDDVVRELPAILRYVAYSADQLSDALDLLWELAQSDRRPTNQFPDHPLRVLIDLASYELGKPLAFLDLIVDSAEQWLARPEDVIVSPFDVLQPLLVTEGHDTTSKGFTLSFTPYVIPAESVSALRKRVNDLALKEASGDDVKRAVRAVHAIEGGLRYPHGLFGRAVATEEHDQWTPEFVDTIKRLGELAAHPDLDSVVCIAIRQALHWHALYSTSATNAAAKQALTRIPTDLRHDLTLHIYDGWGHLLDDDRTDDYEERARRKQQKVTALAQRLLADRSIDEALDLLTERLHASYGGFGQTKPNPGPVVWELVKAEPVVGECICQRVLANPDGPLLAVLSIAMGGLAEQGSVNAITLARSLLGLQRDDLSAQVAHSLGWGRGGRTTLLAGELDLLRELGAHPAEAVRRSVARAADVLAAADRPSAVEVVAHVRFADSSDVAEEVLGVIGPHGHLEWTDFAQTQQRLIMTQLVDCPSLEDYQITSFLSEVSKMDPTTVLKLLMDRVEHDEAAGDGRPFDEYRAMPFDWGDTLHVREHSDFIQILRGIRDWIGAGLTSWRRVKMGAQIFRVAAGGFDDSVIAVLDEHLLIGTKDAVETVGVILAEAPPSVVWNHVDFVSRVLNAAARVGDECLRRVGGYFHSAASAGGRSGTVGEPFPEDVRQKSEAARIADALAPESVVERFYRSLARAAEESIRWSTERDDELLDGRDW